MTITESPFHVAFYKAPCEPFSRCSVSAYLLSSVKVQCYLQSVVTLASLINVLNPSVGPHTTYHILVHRKKKEKKKEEEGVRDPTPPLCRVSPTPKRNISSSPNVSGQLQWGV